MSSNARQLAANLPREGGLSNRSLIINGDHRVSQRGTSAVTVTTSAKYRTVDRWKSDIDGSSGHDWSHEQSTDAPTGFGYSSKITVVTNGTQPTTAGTNHQLYTLLEKQNVQHLEWGTSNAKTVTFSFYVKSSVTGDHGIRFIHYGSSTTPVYNTHYTINTANTWERKTITITGPTTGGITSTANSQAFIVEFKLGNDTTREGQSGYQAWETTNTSATKAGTVYLPATSGATWFVTGCQLEVGDTATPFEHRSYGDELARCQRYYQRYTTSGYGYGRFAICENRAANKAQAVFDLGQEMRAVPTLQTTGTTSNYALYNSEAIIAATAISYDSNPTARVPSIQVSVSGGLVDGGASQFMANNNASSYIAFDAEL